MHQDLETIKNQIKENIQVLIDNNKLEEANVLIDEYFRISNDDVEVYSMKAVVLIMKGQIDKAEDILLNALSYASYNFDLNYNLGYIYCNKKQYELALQYYTKSYMVADDEEIKKSIKLIIKEMLSELNINEDVEVFLESKIVKNEVLNVQRCLVLCHFYSVYTKEFLEKIYNKTNIKFDILTMDSSYKEKVKSGIIDNVYTYNDLNRMNQILNSSESYDIIHIHFLTPLYGEIAEQIRSKCKKLIITIWGSDFYRTNAEQKEQQRKLVDKADIITFDNDVTMDDFAKYYDIANKENLSINRFGLTALEHIKELENMEPDKIKEGYNIPKDSIVVTCGYNANPAHNHLEIIKSIKQMQNKLPQNMYYIFPMTYSRDEKYCDIVKLELAQSGLKYIILEEFMNFEQIAKLTKITDIMIQLQTTDTLSATMQEHMYHGNIIITGSWLPYKPLKQIGAYFLEVFSVNKIGKKLIDVVQRLTIIKQRCKKNKNIIWNFSAWENTAESWIEVYLEYEEPLVTVGIASYNNIKYFDKCIESVLNQNYSNLEILIIDDCSNDGVKDKIIYYEKKYKNIKAIFHEKNSGTAGLAFQEIISKANGEYFALLCSDDYLYSNNTIKAFVNEFFKNPMLDFVFGKFCVINNDNIKIGEWKYKNYTNNEIIYGTFRSFGSARVPMNGGIFKTSFYRDEERTWYTDNELKDTSDGFNTLVNTKYGWKIKYIDEYFIGYRQHENNMTYDLKNRISIVVPNMEYVVENFSEEIYFPEINWNNCIDNERQAAKMYLIGHYYYQMFLYYYNGNWKAFGEYQMDIKKDELFEKLEPIVKKIFKYFYMSLRVSDIYSIEILKIEDNLKQIGYEVQIRSECYES